MEAIANALVWLDYAAVAVFGATGALAAARRKHDIVTFGFFAAVTGVGGGTLRDLLVGAPVFWVAQPGYLVACLAAALAVWFVGPGRGRLRVLLWLDALGMAAYCVVGAAKASALGAPALSAMVMGVLTACFGGVIRDVLAHEPSVLLRREIYVTCAVLGSATFVLLEMVGAPGLPAGLAGFGIAFAVRAGAITWNWSLPGFPGRGDADD
ncbi:MAG TPA: trimeric intracellular cation channel family protein [Phenylobacterium sp.]|nr:trimeric intracellular cation channel family protein [Phenylobacterium sp.]